MAAVTGDAPEMEGTVGATGRIEQGAGGSGVLSADQFPDDGLLGAAKVQRSAAACHDGEISPESRLRGLRHPDRVRTR